MRRGCGLADYIHAARYGTCCDPGFKGVGQTSPAVAVSVAALAARTA
jgi:hypothetical protein